MLSVALLLALGYVKWPHPRYTERHYRQVGKVFLDHNVQGTYCLVAVICRLTNLVTNSILCLLAKAGAEGAMLKGWPKFSVII